MRLLLTTVIFVSGHLYGQDSAKTTLSMDIYIMPYSIPTNGLSDYFSNNTGGAGLGIDYFWNKNFGIVTDLFLSGQTYPKINFKYKDDNWSTTHIPTLAHINVNYSPYLLLTNKNLFYPYIGTGVAWIRSDGDKGDTLPNVNFGPTPTINIGFEYAFLPLKPLTFIFRNPAERLSIKLEYKHLFYGTSDKKFSGGFYHLTFGYGGTSQRKK